MFYLNSRRKKIEIFFGFVKSADAERSFCESFCLCCSMNDMDS